ncbi:FAD-dependent oxidoreductase [Hafnia alvei]|uniref:FAD-dependent oxidoreductase n=1 Tax=Hafnia alvei TaxID=569 RepID=UPI0006224913|nr:FAD-dependent oxidoreductase [Hafnia alvei]KKI41231.1 hypothetical protein XK86_20980 [Hafnia alvei]
MSNEPLDEKFDVIIIGAGIAGSSCALLLARAGMNVLLLERSLQAGEKNMSGGRLYSYSLSRLIPDFATSAPLERLITQERISLLSDESAVTLDYRHPPQAPHTTSYSVLRSRFDPWLLAQAEAAGTQCLLGVNVDALIDDRSGCICGVKMGEEALYAHWVVVAEGANTLLAEKHQLVAKPSPHTMAVGVKEILALPEQTLEDRFTLLPQQGCAWMFAGACTHGIVGGGFIYTNRNSLSLGVVCNLSSLNDTKQSLPQIMDDFRQHPVIAPIIKNSERLEYSAHLIPEDITHSPRSVYGAGYLLIGDAAGYCVNTGYTVRGMDLAVLSAQAAAQTIISAWQKQDFSSSSLSGYHAALKETSLLSLMHRYRHIPEMQLKMPRLFDHYPQLAANFMHDLFTLNETPPPPLRSLLWKYAKRSGITKLLKDLVRGGKSL